VFPHLQFELYLVKFALLENLSLTVDKKIVILKYNFNKSTKLTFTKCCLLLLEFEVFVHLQASAKMRILRIIRSVPKTTRTGPANLSSKV